MAVVKMYALFEQVRYVEGGYNFTTLILKREDITRKVCPARSKLINPFICFFSEKTNYKLFFGVSML